MLGLVIALLALQCLVVVVLLSILGVCLNMGKSTESLLGALNAIRGIIEVLMVELHSGDNGGNHLN